MNQVGFLKKCGITGALHAARLLTREISPFLHCIFGSKEGD